MKVDFLAIINMFKPKRRLFLGVVFFFSTQITLSQSKKEQINVLLIQRDSLIKVISQKDVQIATLSEQSLSQSITIKQTEERNSLLVDQLTQKNQQINELITKKNCLSVKTEAWIETLEGLEPKLILTSHWNGFTLKMEQEGENETYPNRLYSFRYSFDNMEVDLPVGGLFNENRILLQNRLNE
jgi:hypothetical protein